MVRAPLLLTIAAVAVAIAVVAALLLGLGTALSPVFAISVREAPAVVMVAAWGTIWSFANVLFPTADLPDELGDPAVWVTDLPRGARAAAAGAAARAGHGVERAVSVSDVEAADLGQADAGSEHQGEAPWTDLN